MKNNEYAKAGAGYQAGYLEGYRLGGCSAVLSKISSSIKNKKRYDWRVLYIPQGFDAIDQGVIDALQDLVAECIVGSPQTLLEAASNTRPDFMLVMNGMHVFPANHLEQVQEVRKLGIRTAVWFVDDPYFTDDSISIAQSYDVVFTHEIECVSLYQSFGCSSVHYLPLAANPKVFHPTQVTKEYQYDICFIGNAFWNRVELFDYMASYLQDKKVMIAGGHWERLNKYELLSRFVRPGWLPIQETMMYYNGSKIVINLHRPTRAGDDNRNAREIPGGSINPRTYEIAACGAFQLTDIRQDLTSFYEPGYDIETYSNPTELMEKIDYYLANDTERMHIVWRSLKTTSQYHTFHHRIESMLAVVSIV